MIIFYLKETFRIFKKSSFATAVTITVTTTAVLLSTISFFLVFSVNKLSDQIKRSIEVNVYLDDSVLPQEVEIIKEKIRNSPAVLSVNFISKDNAAKKFVEETGEDFRTVLDQNPLPNSLIVKFKPQALNEKNIELFTEQFKKIHGVTDVVYDYKTVLRILNLLKSFEYTIYFLSIILILLSVYLVYSNNKIQMFGNRHLYITMKLVGAQTKTMKIPIILNGIFIGLISSLISISLLYTILILLAKIYDNLRFIRPPEVLIFLIPAVGILLGFIGSFISSLKISQLLKEK
ncbi:MAG: permease-like cell division protein FtsX [Bacteroidota bacterium]